MHCADLCPAIQATLVRLPAPHQAHYGVVPPAPPVGIVGLGELTQRHDAAVRALGEVESYARRLRAPFLISRVLTRQEAVSSSAIEGAHSTLDELLVLEATEGEDTTAATRQVRQYALALERFVRTAAREGPDVFTLRFVRRLHERVMRDDPDYPDTPGALRQQTVWIGGGRDIAYSSFNPPPAARVEACLEGTVAYMRDEEGQSLGQSLFTRMAIAHAHFEAVHPFRDGNGRVGRMLLPLMMAADQRAPLYLSGYIEAYKPEYISALKLAQQQLQWGAMIGFICDAVVGSAAELMATRDALERLRQLWLGRRAFRKGSSALQALDLLPHYPVVTVGRLAELLQVTFPAAAKAVQQLEEVGILMERTGYARNRVFRAHEALSVMGRPFGAEPVLPS